MCLNTTMTLIPYTKYVSGKKLDIPSSQPLHYLKLLWSAEVTRSHYPA